MEIISHRRHAFDYFEICLEGKDTPTLFQPASYLSLTEALVFSAIQAPVQFCQLLLACHSSSPDCVLASIWADRPTRGDPNAEALPSKSLTPKAFSAFLTEVWNKELTSSPNGATNRLFFPRSCHRCLAPAPSLQCSDVSATVRTLRSQLPSASLWLLCLPCLCVWPFFRIHLSFSI